MPSEINASLKQQGSYGQQREYQIVDGKNIRIAIGSKVRNKVYAVPILALGEKSKPRLHIAWAWLWLAVVGIVAIPVYLFIKTLLGVQNQGYDFAILAALVVMVLVGCVMLALNFSRRRVFFSAYSKIPLFDILIGKPDYKSYKEFLNSLEGYLQKTRRFFDLRADQQIAGEIRMLRRLAGEGIIPQKVYEEAKEKLFALSNKTSRASN